MSLPKIALAALMGLLFVFVGWAQNPDIKNAYYRNEEIHFQKKRYLVHNNYVTAGPGFAWSGIQKDVQRTLSVDLHLHIRKTQWLSGAIMSGDGFGSTNYLQLHTLYGYRNENTLYNIGCYAGPSWNSGVQTRILNGSKYPYFYNDWGMFVTLQGHKKLWYDIGIGLELFLNYTARQSLAGIRVTAFFSNAFKGKQIPYNPNVRAQPARP